MSTTITAAQQQILNEWEKTKKRLLPAVLTDTTADGHKITAYMVEHKLAPTQDNFYDAIKALMAQLSWRVKPAALVALEKANAPPLVENPRLAEEARQKVVKAAEQHDKDAKEHAALVTQCKNLIDSYFPRTRMGRLDAREQNDSQAKWRASLAQAEKGSVAAMREYTKSLTVVVEKRYRDQEAALERM